MPDTGSSRSDDRVLGTVVKIPQFPVSVTALVGVAVVVLTVWFWKGGKDVRETLTFFVLAGALAGGAVSAFYLWAGVKTAILQRRASAEEQKIQFALLFVTRWNDPNMAETRLAWRKLIEEIETNQTGIVALIKDDVVRRTIVADVLNFFEEMGYAAKSGAADCETLRESFYSVVLKYFKIARPWIEHRREPPLSSTTAWTYFEWLSDQWK